jgi:hypothetical protein
MPRLVLALALFLVGEQPSQRLGALLRPGTQMLYMLDASETFWTVDSIARDTVLGGRPHCVRFRLRLDIRQTEPDTRAYCADSLMMYGWDDRTRTHTALRPLSAGGVLDVKAGDMTIHYESGAMTMDRISGTPVEVIPTTITIRDATGTVVRRVRERFSLGLATATGGVFEMPDSSAASGWRQEQRYEIINLRQWRPPLEP